MDPVGFPISLEAPSDLDKAQSQGKAPLSFTQWSHWRLSRLWERPAVRQIVSATRLRGPLNREVLQRSLEELIRRHSSLRTQIILSDNVPVQEVVGSCRCEIEFIPLLKSRNLTREKQISLEIESFVLNSIDISQAPLLGVKVLGVAPEEHILIVAMEHSISDAFSMGIFLRELFSAYFQVLARRDVVLPSIAIQFPEYATRQRKAHSSWLSKHTSYWRGRLGEGQRLRFPEDEHHPVNSRTGWDVVPIRFETPLKSRFSEFCRAHHVTLPVGMFAAYSAFTLHWCGSSRGIFLYQSDGRVNSRVQNTIGLFAAVLYLGVEVCPRDRFRELLSRAMEEYCCACEHFDHAFMESCSPRPEFTRNSGFSWIPATSTQGLPEAHSGENPIELSPMNFDHPLRKFLERDFEPSLGLCDRDHYIDGGMHFPLNRFCPETLKRFVNGFLVFVAELVREPEGYVTDIARRALL